MAGSSGNFRVGLKNLNLSADENVLHAYYGSLKITFIECNLNHFALLYWWMRLNLNSVEFNLSENLTKIISSHSRFYQREHSAEALFMSNPPPRCCSLLM